MSQGPNDAGHVELSCVVGELKVSITGPSGQAAELLQRVLEWGASQRTSSPTASAGSFDLVSQAAPDSPEPSRRTLESRAQIERGFRDCPDIWLRQANRLSGSSTPGAERAKRAWRAGQWGAAVVCGRAHSPNRSVHLDLRSRFYAILRAPGLSGPTLCTTATACWRIIGDLENSSSVSHAFPSELEAKIYLAGAGIAEFNTAP